MSSALDAVVTITLFVGVAPVLFYLAAVGLLGILIETSTEDQPPRRLSHKMFQLSALALQPLLMLGVYVAAIVLACLASGLTFYYPLAALAIGCAAWWFTIERIPAWINHRLAVHEPS